MVAGLTPVVNNVPQAATRRRPPRTDLGWRLLDLMKANGIRTRADLAIEIGKSQSLVTAVVAGTRPVTREFIEALCLRFKLDRDEWLAIAGLSRRQTVEEREEEFAERVAARLKAHLMGDGHREAEPLFARGGGPTGWNARAYLAECFNRLGHHYGGDILVKWNRTINPEDPAALVEGYVAEAERAWRSRQEKPLPPPLFCGA